jgi:serine beta-lactamase-like protein LACTB, mitochondrial
MKIFESGKRSRRNKLSLAIVLCGVNGLLAVQSPAQQAATQAATTQEPATKAKQISSGRYAEAKENADRQAKEWLARGIPGITMAVAVDGKIIYSEGYGLADLEQRVPVWPTTKFRIASISKPLTAVALMQLVETGKVDLDAPIQKYVPSFPDKGALITTRMVAGHLAGIRHYKDKEFEISSHYDSVTEGLKIFEDDPLVAPPGTKFSYSSYGFNLVSAVIEAASGENFLAYMQNHVFTPLGMPHTTADQNKPIVEERARFYELTKAGNAENTPYVDNSYKWAGGGFLSTAEDLVRFGSALLRPGFLKEESLKQLFASQKTKAGDETGYGIGWGVGKTSNGKIFYAHSGGAVGGTSQLIVYPESGVVIAMINNLSDAPWKVEEVRAVAEKFIDEGK